ncbi:hypothetical protein ACLOJK_037890 [Asimina triloba]
MALLSINRGIVRPEIPQTLKQQIVCPDPGTPSVSARHRFSIRWQCPSTPARPPDLPQQAAKASVLASHQSTPVIPQRRLSTSLRPSRPRPICRSSVVCHDPSSPKTLLACPSCRSSSTSAYPFAFQAPASTEEPAPLSSAARPIARSAGAHRSASFRPRLAASGYLDQTHLPVPVPSQQNPLPAQICIVCSSSLVVVRQLQQLAVRQRDQLLTGDPEPIRSTTTRSVRCLACNVRCLSAVHSRRRLSSSTAALSRRQEEPSFFGEEDGAPDGVLQRCTPFGAPSVSSGHHIRQPFGDISSGPHISQSVDDISSGPHIRQSVDDISSGLHNQ